MFVSMVSVVKISSSVECAVCNGCHNVLMMPMNLGDIAYLNINSADYRCIINGISKSQAVNLLQKAETL